MCGRHVRDQRGLRSDREWPVNALPGEVGEKDATLELDCWLWVVRRR